MNRLFLARTLGILLFLAPSLLAAETVHWLIDDQPPQYILSGADQGMGSLDGVLKYFQERLPSYSHTFTQANIQRGVALLQTDGPYAAVGYIKTPEREKLLMYSQPFTVVLPPGLLIRKTDLDKVKPFLTSDGRLDLDRMLNAGALRVGVAAGRSYGPAIDAIVARYQNGPVVLTRFAASGIMAGLVQMLGENRVDAVFAFRSEVRYVIRDEEKLAELSVLPIFPAGNLLTIHAVVPRTDWGRALLDKLDPLIVKARTDPVFRALSDRWIDDEGKAAIVRALRAMD